MSNFRELRNVELSAITYIRAQLNAAFTGVTTVLSFKQADKAALPVVCVRLLDINPLPKEIGTTTRRNQFGLVIDVFATSDGQRLDLVSLLTDSLNDGFIYYEHEKVSGSETLATTVSGRVRLRTYTQNSRVDFGEDVDANDRFRHIISVILERN